MINKPAYNVIDQTNLLKSRGMLFRDEVRAASILKNISYYRLKGYWWDMQIDCKNHSFEADSYFEDVVERYNFDRQLRLILFDAIERIEIALRTKMVYYLSLSYGGLWYKDATLFNQTLVSGNSITFHSKIIQDLRIEFTRSQEVFIKDHRTRYPNDDPDAWKILEIASMGSLSKLYKTLKHQLPEKSIIAKEMGLNIHTELSSWLEAITYTRNIIAHHSRLWSRNMVKQPIEKINNPIGIWLNSPLKPVQRKRPFLVISCMLYLCNHVLLDHKIKEKILMLIKDYPKIPIYKLGFLDDWDEQPIWK